MKSELESIVLWLEGGDETQWHDQTALAEEYLATMRQRVLPVHRKDKTGTRSAEPAVFHPDAAKFNRAILHVDCMVEAMQRRNREKALVSAKAAVAEL